MSQQVPAAGCPPGHRPASFGSRHAPPLDIVITQTWLPVQDDDPHGVAGHAPTEQRPPPRSQKDGAPSQTTFGPQQVVVMLPSTQLVPSVPAQPASDGPPLEEPEDPEELPEEPEDPDDDPDEEPDDDPDEDPPPPPSPSGASARPPHAAATRNAQSPTARVAQRMSAARSKRRSAAEIRGARPCDRVPESLCGAARRSASLAACRFDSPPCQGMQHTVVGDDGATVPVGVPPSGRHDPPLATSAPRSITLPGSDRPPHAAGSSFTGPV